MAKSFERYRTFNDKTNWMMIQISFWSILPLLSSVGGEFLIDNSNLYFEDFKY